MRNGKTESMQLHRSDTMAVISSYKKITTGRFYLFYGTGWRHQGLRSEALIADNAPAEANAYDASAIEHSKTPGGGWQEVTYFKIIEQ